MRDRGLRIARECHARVESRESALAHRHEQGVLVGEVVVRRTRRDIERLGDGPEGDVVRTVLADGDERLVDHGLGEGSVVVAASHDSPSCPRILTTFIFAARVPV